MKIQQTHWQPFSAFFQHQPRGTVSYSWHLAKRRPYSSTNGWTGVTGHCCWWTNKWNGGKISGEDFFFFCSFFFFFLNPSANEEKCQCVWWLVYVLNAVYFLCTPGQWGLLHSVLRVGVLGWLRPIVLHNQPAKSTSSTSDRLMNVWFYERAEEKPLFECNHDRRRSVTAIKWQHKAKKECRYPPSGTSGPLSRMGFWSDCRSNRELSSLSHCIK